MAAGPLLISEPLQRYRALGMAGDPVWRAAGQLRTAIAARLSRKHADLLAIPEVDPTGQRIDWYAPFEGDARKLSDLGEAERAPLLDEVHRLHGEIAGLADSMEAPQRSSAERNFARLLRHGVRPDNKASIPPLMPFSEMSDEDIIAILSFLRVQRPVRNAVPENEWTLFGKVMKSIVPATKPKMDGHPPKTSPPAR